MMMLVISKLIETKTNSKYLIGYLDNVIKPLFLILPRLNGYVKTCKIKDEDKYKNNKMMSVRKDDDKILKNIKPLRLQYFTVISIGSSLVYKNKYFLQLYLDNCAYKIVDKQMIDYLGDNLFETDKD